MIKSAVFDGKRNNEKILDRDEFRKKLLKQERIYITFYNINLRGQFVLRSLFSKL